MRGHVRERLPWSQLTSWASGLAALDLPDDVLILLAHEPAHEPAHGTAPPEGGLATAPIPGDSTPGRSRAPGRIPAPTPGAVAALAGHQAAVIAVRLHICSPVADTRVRLSVTSIGVATLARIASFAGAPVQGELALVPVDEFAREMERWIPRRPGRSRSGPAAEIRVEVLVPADSARKERWVACDGRWWCVQEGTGQRHRVATVCQLQEELLSLLLARWANTGWVERG